MNLAAFAESSKRTMERLQVRIVVQDSLRSAPLGNTSDMSMDGFFLATDALLPVGSMLPVGLTLGGGGIAEVSTGGVRALTLTHDVGQNLVCGQTTHRPFAERLDRGVC